MQELQPSPTTTGAKQMTTLKVFQSNGGYIILNPDIKAVNGLEIFAALKKRYPEVRHQMPFFTFDGDRMMQWFVPSNIYSPNNLYSIQTLTV